VSSQRPARALEPSGPLADLAGAHRPPPPSGPSGPAPVRSARTAWPAVRDADALHPVPATGLLDLPQDIRGSIANAMSLRDAAWMSCVSRDLRQPEGVLRSALLALDQMPADEFARERGTLMKRFAEMLDQEATPEKLHKTVCHFYGDMPGISSAVRSEVLTLLAERVGRMPDDQRVDVLDGPTSDTLKVLRKADMQMPLQALARQIKHYPSDRRFDMVALYACQNQYKRPDGDGPLGPSLDSHLDPPQRAQVLATLAGEMKSMPDGPATWGYLLSRAVALPPEHRPPVLDALDRQHGAFQPAVRRLAERNLALERARCRP
jgi:hypothetical protein